MACVTRERSGAWLRIWCWPAAQAALFAAFAISADDAPGRAVTALVAASLAMCFTLHVSAHERLHRGTSAAEELLFSLMLGIPFHGYAWQHWKHHRHVNSLEDPTSTWTVGPDGPVPQQPVGYAFGWPRQLARSVAWFRREAAENRSDEARYLRREQAAIAALWIALALVSVPVFAGYAAMTYLGWALIGLQNYGQHPPARYDTGFTTSYASAVYNHFLLNNGLHKEHHDSPATPSVELTRSANAQSAGAPHLLAAFAAWRAK